MRNIKFRAWNKFYTSGDIILDFDLPYDDVVLEQFTGLYDKNGKEIYEGDYIDFAGHTWVVEFSRQHAGYRLSKELSSTALKPYYENNYEIIGNIHENKELINGEGS